MRFHLTPLLTEPEPSSRPVLTLLLVLIVGAAVAAAVAQIARAGV